MTAAKPNISKGAPPGSGRAISAYTDADVNGPVVHALVDQSWDVLRAIDVFPEGTDDEVHFAHAARENRVMVANDVDVKLLAER